MANFMSYSYLFKFKQTCINKVTRQRREFANPSLPLRSNEWEVVFLKTLKVVKA